MLADALLACALMVHPATLDAVVRVESHGYASAIHVNGINDKDQPRNLDSIGAAAIARRYIAAGRSVDLGLMQVNSRNLAGLNLTVEQVMDPCTNLHAGGTILAAFYSKAAQRYGQGQTALIAALSAFNTGDEWRGIRNGYVSKYYVVPAIAVVVAAAIPAKVNRHASDTEVW